nr:hypothetical protein [Shigella flexneri]
MIASQLARYPLLLDELLESKYPLPADGDRCLP